MTDRHPPTSHVVAKIALIRIYVARVTLTFYSGLYLIVVSVIFNVEKYHDLEITARDQSR